MIKRGAPVGPGSASSAPARSAGSSASKAVPRWGGAAFERAACWTVFGGLTLFAFAMGGAIGAYPGGTQFDRTARGFSFWSNFWCDALRNPSLNGALNARGARCATLALWALGLGLLPYWRLLAAVAVGPPTPLALRFRRLIRGLGKLGTLGMMGVALVPSDRFPLLHAVFVSVAAPSGILAAALATWAGWTLERVPRAASLLGGAALFFAIASLLEYERELWWVTHAAPLLPVIQKVATLSFIGWVIAVSATSYARHAPRADSR
jgi:hypothetical protein